MPRLEHIAIITWAMSWHTPRSQLPRIGRGRAHGGRALGIFERRVDEVRDRIRGVDHIANRAERVCRFTDLRVGLGEWGGRRGDTAPMRRIDRCPVADEDCPRVEFDRLLHGGHADVDDGVAETVLPSADSLAVRPDVEAVSHSVLIPVAFARHDHQALAQVAHRPGVLVRDRLVQEIDRSIGSDQGVAGRERWEATRGTRRA